MFFGKKKKKAEETSSDIESTTTETETQEASASDNNGEQTDMADNENIANETETETLTVPAEDMALLNRYRTAGEDVVKELGNIEIRKARMIASYGQLEQASQQKLMEIGEKLGIAEGTGWSVSPDGTVNINTVPEAAATESESEATE